MAQSGAYPPADATIGLISVGLAIKSGLWPFHSWMPTAYGLSTVPSAAILSSLVSKRYIFLLIKVIYRVVGKDIFLSSDIIVNVLFVFSVLSVLFVGSVEPFGKTTSGI
ncbi:MAG: proton-conducting transporter membrane subunit [Eubacterium sp.]